MLSTVRDGLVAAAKKATESFPEHQPFVALHERVSGMSTEELREALDVHLLPVAPRLQKNDIEFFKTDAAFASLRLNELDFEGKDELVNETFQMLNHVLLLSSTMALLPKNLLDVAQNMASQLTNAVSPDGTVNQAAMTDILGMAMQAAGLNAPVSKSPESAQQRLKNARKNLM